MIQFVVELLQYDKREKNLLILSCGKGRDTRLNHLKHHSPAQFSLPLEFIKCDSHIRNQIRQQTSETNSLTIFGQLSRQSPIVSSVQRPVISSLDTILWQQGCHYTNHVEFTAATWTGTMWAPHICSHCPQGCSPPLHNLQSIDHCIATIEY